MKGDRKKDEFADQKYELFVFSLIFLKAFPGKMIFYIFKEAMFSLDNWFGPVR